MSDEKLPRPKFVFTARWPQTLMHVGFRWLMRVEPPVKLAAGESVELWWYIADGSCRYRHAGSPR